MGNNYYSIIQDDLCLYCRAPIQPDISLMECSDCKALYHTGCWEQNRGCAKFGCKGSASELEVLEGVQFDSGYISPYMVTNNDRMEAVLENPVILVCEKKISAVVDLVPLLEKMVAARRILLVIAEDVDGDALATLVVNTQRGTVQSYAVKAPGFGDRRKAMLEDIATFTGGQFISEDAGFKLRNTDLAMLGGAIQVVITKDKTTIIGGQGAFGAVQGSIAQIEKQVGTTGFQGDNGELQEHLIKFSCVTCRGSYSNER